MTKNKMHYHQKAETKTKSKSVSKPARVRLQTPSFSGELTSGSWTATRPRALRWGSGRSEPGSLSSTHACSPQCQTQRGAGRSLHPPPPLESEGPLSGTS